MAILDSLSMIGSEIGGWLTIPSNQMPGITLPFGLKIRYYALSYLAGIVLAWWYIKRLVRQPAAPMSELHVDDFIMWATLGVVFGGRFGHILFYDPEGYYLRDPLSMLKLWQGGMSFHGGAFGVLVAVVLFSWKHKLRGLRVIDYVSCAVPIGLFTGRLANFANGELWGREAPGLPWGVVFSGANAALGSAAPDLPRHPSQLYEAGLEGLVLFGILYFLFWHTDARRKPGVLVGTFVLGYGAFRFLIEFVRVADTQLVGKTGALHMGQWLCVPMILAGLFLILTARSRKAA
jgi:phosphatidylglycerol---prolipoprotein diacylglyceryl transferase